MRVRLNVLCLGLLSLALAATGCFGPRTLPIAAFTWTHETAFDVLFDATASNGGDCVLVSWEWTFGDGEAGTGATVWHTYATPGDYTVELTVTNERGFRASERHTVHAIRELLVPEEFWTIQEAIDDAGTGDVVIVSPGLYWENFTFRGKAVCVRSVDPDDPGVVAGTVIEPGRSGGGWRVGPVVTFDSGEGSGSVLEGLTIRGVAGAGATNGNGALVRSASPTIRGNVFANHLAGSSGAALYLVDSDAIVADNLFYDNTCDPLQVGQPADAYGSNGGAIYVLCGSSAPDIFDNEFKNNTAIAGGAIYVGVENMGGGSAVARAEIHGNTFISNRATGQFSGKEPTTEVGGAIHARYETLVDLGPGDTNSYLDNKPDGHDVYYDDALIAGMHLRAQERGDVVQDGIGD